MVAFISIVDNMGLSAAAHRLSVPPSQPNHRCSPALSNVCELRKCVSAPMLTRRPSVKPRAGLWQLAQENSPLPDKAVSLNSCSPACSAQCSPEYSLPGSPGMVTGHGPCSAMRACSAGVKVTSAWPGNTVTSDTAIPITHDVRVCIGNTTTIGYCTCVRALSVSSSSATLTVTAHSHSPGMWNSKPSAR